MMGSGSMSFREWQWPSAGPTAVNYGLDTEIFDSEKFPHVQTFVREAIQNSLDARLDKAAPVRVRFGFYEGSIGSRADLLGDLIRHKQQCGMAWPPEWMDDRVTWLVVEDSNTSGLAGDLRSRASDFWNYWLNFGISNKSGAGRGGRGIGRITFLIASGISTVIGVTRRANDGTVAACGMSLLKPHLMGNDFKSSYAYLAKAPSDSIYELYDGPEFIQELVEAFKIADYTTSGSSGLSLIIPFPHQTLTGDAIVAAVIEHFAPAIISGALVIETNGLVVDRDTIDRQAERVAAQFSPGPMREDPSRQLKLIRHTTEKPAFIITITRPTARLEEAIDSAEREKLRDAFLSEEQVSIGIDIPLTRHGAQSVSRLCAAISQTPKGRKSTDMFFREGMCLPEVQARHAAEVDLIVQSNEGELVSYLNFCEGKAHLGLIENKEVRQKLVENGFLEGYTVKRLVRRLMDELRSLVLPDTNKPDATVFSGYFSIPRRTPDTSAKLGGPGVKNPNVPTAPVPPSLPKAPTIFLVDELPDGFRIRANPEQKKWPANLRAEIVYSDGSRSPKWSEYDFELASMQVERQGVAGELSIKNNVLTVRDCGADFSIELRGFDVRRELITNVKGFRNA